MRLLDDVTVSVEAHLGAWAAEAVAEPVVLRAGGVAIAQAAISGSNGPLGLAVFAIEEFTVEVQTELVEMGSVAPDDFALMLSGFTVTPYSRLSPGQLEELARLYAETTSTFARLAHDAGESSDDDDENGEGQ